MRCLYFVEQAHIFDRDHGLVGKGRDEIDLLLGKRLDALSSKHDDTGRLVFAQQRHAEGSVLAGKRNRFSHRVFGIGRNIENLYRAALQHRAAGHRAAIRPDRVLLQKFDVVGGKADRSASPIDVAIPAQDEGHLGVAQMRGGLDQRVEHGLQVESRAADGFQHVADGGLLLQRFRKLAGALLHFGEQADVADGDHGLVGERFQKADLLVAEWMHLHATKQDRADAFSLPQERHADNGAMAQLRGELPAKGKLVLFRQHIMYMHCFFVDEGAPGRKVPADPVRRIPDRNWSVMSEERAGHHRL